jgi:carboxylate-amine ligase
MSDEVKRIGVMVGREWSWPPANFPRTGIPGQFVSYAEFQSYVDLLIKTGCIDNGKKIWWDVRPHPIFNTIEVRICDIATKVNEVMALAALIQAIFVKLYWLFEKNLSFRMYNRSLINENKWRAVAWTASSSTSANSNRFRRAS